MFKRTELLFDLKDIEAFWANIAIQVLNTGRLLRPARFKSCICTVWNKAQKSYMCSVFGFLDRLFDRLVVLVSGWFDVVGISSRNDLWTEEVKFGFLGRLACNWRYFSFRSC